MILDEKYKESSNRLADLAKWFEENPAVSTPTEEDREAIALMLARATTEVPLLFQFSSILMSLMMASAVYGTRKGYELRKLEELVG